MDHFDKGTQYTKETFANIILEESALADIVFEDCTFLGCKWIACTIHNCKFIHCTFKNCDMSGCKMRGSSFLSVHFASSKVMGIDWTVAGGASALKMEISFEKSNLSYSSFAGMSIQKMKIIDSIAHEVDFGEADMEGADLAGTDCKDAIFIRTNLKKANFVKAINYAINPIDNKVSKAKFSLPDAAILLKQFNVIIEDEHGEKLLS